MVEGERQRQQESALDGDEHEHEVRPQVINCR